MIGVLLRIVAIFCRCPERLLRPFRHPAIPFQNY
ncbi:hypothetical protein Atc_0796 [Acidithiobacillus caldus SM-1]|uniref:Uncharacterized protein n=1 Tax=Acidithiobacillus caldus (strain SM-1) TaxID=990288 RepID=F9ZLW3_ACICS|nr:hypothetical protein Atc_0796 [Acidithiobacillus caldus SM-1]QER44117.1 hypothetical protein F0726_01040 [Acidithiobacillus caldus]